MDDDPFVNQDSIFKKHINVNLESKIGENKSDKQQQQVILNIHGIYDPVAIEGAVSEENTDDDVDNAQESKTSNENRKRTILNNYKDAFQYQCRHGNWKINILAVNLYMVFRME